MKLADCLLSIPFRDLSHQKFYSQYCWLLLYKASTTNHDFSNGLIWLIVTIAFTLSLPKCMIYLEKDTVV